MSVISLDIEAAAAVHSDVCQQHSAGGSVVDHIGRRGLCFERLYGRANRKVAIVAAKNTDSWHFLLAVGSARHA